MAAKKKKTRKTFDFVEGRPDAFIRGVRFVKGSVVILAADGRQFPLLLEWHPRLFDAGRAERRAWQLTEDGFGLEWPKLGESVCLKKFLA